MQRILFFSQKAPKIRSRRPDVFCVQKVCRKFTGEYLCQSVISIKLQSNVIEIILWHGCSPVNFLYIFTKHFPENTSG